jgi:hypothetical protein
MGDSLADEHELETELKNTSLPVSEYCLAGLFRQLFRLGVSSSILSALQRGSGRAGPPAAARKTRGYYDFPLVNA